MWDCTQLTRKPVTVCQRYCQVFLNKLKNSIVAPFAEKKGDINLKLFPVNYL